MVSSTSFAESPQIPDILYEMGARMKKYSTWFWIVMGSAIAVSIIGSIPFIIFAFVYEEFILYIGFGLIGLLTLCLSCISLYNLYLYFQYLKSVKDLRDATNDPVFEKVYQYLLIGFILQFAGLTVVTFILNILCFIELENWAGRMERELPTPEMTNVTEGYKWMKIGTIVTVFCPLGMFVIPIAYAKVGKALMAEYNSSQFEGIGTTRPWPIVSFGPGYTSAPPTQTYAAPAPTTQTYAAPAPKAPAPSSQQKEIVTCPHCGTETPKHLAGKFCGKCGKSYEVTPSPQATPADQTYKPVEDIVKCAHCGAENPKGTVFCEVCGKSM